MLSCGILPHGGFASGYRATFVVTSSGLAVWGATGHSGNVAGCSDATESHNGSYSKRQVGPLTLAARATDRAV
jgi:hypothetical protein